MTNTFDGFPKSGLDAHIEELLDAHFAKFGFTPLDALKHFTVYARRQWLKRFISHLELFKLTLDVPGDIAELGVFRGMGLFTWANLLESFCIGDRTKVVYGFDNWEGFNEFAEEDGQEIERAHKVRSGFSPKNFYDELINAIKIYDSDRFIPNKARIQLVKGDIETTVREFVEKNSGVRFSLVHFDCDMYAPTKAALTSLWPILSRGGVFIFDEYSIHDWPGETKAVDEFFQDKQDVRIKKFQWTNTPGGYIVKE
jgi:hypothetical protein